MGYRSGCSLAALEQATGAVGGHLMLMALLALQAVLAGPAGSDPFAFFRPSVTLSADERRQLDRGEPIARVLPSQDREVAVFVAMPVDIDGNRLVAWMRRITELKKSSYVLAIGRFSNPPRIEDLAGLALDDDELTGIRQCRPGACALKLARGEIDELQSAIAQAGSNWKPILQDAFRHLMLQRVQAYLADGLAGLRDYEDQSRPVSLAERFSLLLRHSTFLSERVPQLVEHLDRYPRTSLPNVESFVYWSKERLGRKPIVSATHVSILRGTEAAMPDALVAGKEVFSTHYVTASLGVTAILRGTAGSHNYLAYLNRTEIDVLGGRFSGMLRWFIERRLKPESAEVLKGLRLRLASGEPPGTGVALSIGAEIASPGSRQNRLRVQP